MVERAGRAVPVIGWRCVDLSTQCTAFMSKQIERSEQCATKKSERGRRSQGGFLDRLKSLPAFAYFKVKVLRSSPWARLAKGGEVRRGGRGSSAPNAQAGQ